MQAHAGECCFERKYPKGRLTKQTPYISSDYRFVAVESDKATGAGTLNQVVSDAAAEILIATDSFCTITIIIQTPSQGFMPLGYVSPGILTRYCLKKGNSCSIRPFLGNRSREGHQTCSQDLKGIDPYTKRRGDEIEAA